MVLVIGEVVVELDIVGEDRGVMGIESDRFDISAVVRVGGVVSKIVRRGLETQRWRGGARDKDGVLRSVGCSVRRGRWGVCPECRQGVERICRAITKQVQRSDARIEVDVMHTWNECTE
jgi:hypothetical protein